MGQFLDTLVRMIRPLGESISRLPQAITMEQRMQQADLPFRGADFIVLMVLVGFFVGLIAAILFRSLFSGIIIGIIAIAACFFWLQLYIKRRRAAFVDQLGDALVMMANALRAGFSFNQAMGLIGREMNPPISSEFTKTVMELQLGASTEVAMENMGRRMPSKDLNLVITAVLIQRQVGGNLSQILDTVAETLMERVRMKREIRALTAQGRLSGYVLVCLPFFFAIAMYMISPEFMQPMLTQTLGHILIGVGIFMDFVGLMVIRKLVNIEL
jgi:tight adherence protein B